MPRRALVALLIGLAACSHGVTAESPALSASGGAAALPPEPMPARGWGEESAGVRLSVAAPGEIEQGTPLATEFRFVADPARLAPGVKAIDVWDYEEFQARCVLRLRDAAGREVVVRPYSPSGPPMPPPPDGDADGIGLLAGETAPVRVTFPLVRAYDALPPGAYQVVVSYSFDAKVPPAWGAQADAWRARGLWTGTVTSAEFPLVIRPEMPRTRTWRLPTSLAAVTTDDGRLVVRAAGEEDVVLPDRNGRGIVTTWARDGFVYSIEGGREPHAGGVIDDERAVDGGLRGKSARYDVEVREITEPLVHGSSRAGTFRVLWSRSFRVTFPR